jgi:hypothetical protein
MKTNPEIWRNAFLQGVIDHTEDSMEATLAAIELGGVGGSVACGLHPQYVLAQQGEKLEFALWAVHNCHSDEALAEIANTTVRTTILRAIAASPWALAETRALAAQKVRAAYNGAGTLVPPQLAESPSFTTYATRRPLSNMPRGLGGRGVAPEVVEELIDGAMAIDAEGTVSSIVHDYYGAASGGYLGSLWETYPVDILGLLARLAKLQRIRVLGAFLSDLRMSHSKRAHLIGENILAVIMEEVPLSTIESLRTIRGGRHTKAFSTRAFNVLLADPSRHHLLEVHHPSPRQLKKILDCVQGEHREHWLYLIREDRPLLRIALDYKGPGALSDEELLGLMKSNALSMASLTSGKDDDFYTQIVSLMDAIQVAYYVVNGVVVRSSGVGVLQFAENSEVRGLVERVGSDEPWEEAFSSLSATNSLYSADEERARVLCEHVPGAWRILIGHKVIGTEIREALLKSGRGLQDILHLLYEKESPLYTFAEALALLEA